MTTPASSSTPTPTAYTLDQAHAEIAALRNTIAKIQNVVSTASDKAVLLYAPGSNAIPRGPSSWSFEDGTTSGWTAINGAVSNSVVSAAGWPTNGTHSLLLTANGAGAPQATSPATTTTFIPSQPGDPVSVLIDVYCPAAVANAFAAITWLDDTGAQISFLLSPLATFAAGQVQTLVVSGSAPDLCAGFYVAFGSNNVLANGTLMYGDNIRVQGNLAISASPGGGTDPVGNSYPAGVAAYSTAGNAVLGATQLVFNLLGNVFAGALAPTAAVSNAAGVPGILLTSPSNKSAGGGNSQAVIGVVGESQDGTLGPYIYLGSGQFGSSAIQSGAVYCVGGGLVYAAPGVAGGALVAETWHTISSGPAGWTVSVSYRFLAETGLVMVQVIANVANGTAVTFAETIVTLPAGYAPSNGKGFACTFFNGTVDTAQPWVIQSSGAVQYAGAGFTAGATAQFTGQVIYTRLI